LRVPQDERIARRSAQESVEYELDPRGCSRSQVIAFQHRGARHSMSGTQMNVHRGTIRNAFASREEPQSDVDAPRGDERLRMRKPVAACHLGFLGAGKQQRTALPRAPHGGLAILCVDAAHSHRHPSRHHGEPIAYLDAACAHHAGHDRAAAGKREHAVDRQPKQPVLGVSAGGRGGHRMQMRSQGNDTRIVGGRCDERKLRRAAQGPLREQGRNLLLYGPHARLGHPIDFRERHGPLRHPEELEDGEVLTRLGHDPIVRGNDQEGEIDPAGTRHHGVNQPLVAGHIDVSQYIAAGERRVGVAELDGDAAFPLLLEPIGIDTRERAHQARLAMIDMSRRADDHGLARRQLATPAPRHSIVYRAFQAIQPLRSKRRVQVP